MFNAIKRLFIYLGLMAEKATETQAIDEAQVERSIRDQRAKAAAASKANGDLKAQAILLKQTIRDQTNETNRLTGMLQIAAQQNDTENGATYAEQLDTLQQELDTNKERLNQLDAIYEQNNQIIATSLKEIERVQRDFIALKARVKVSQNMVHLSELIKSSIGELQGMTDTGQAMQRMKERAAQGEGQMTATMDLAKTMGATTLNTQAAKNARGRALFEQFKAKNNLTNPEVPQTQTQTQAPETPQTQPARQPITEN